MLKCKKAIVKSHEIFFEICKPSTVLKVIFYISGRGAGDLVIKLIRWELFLGNKKRKNNMISNNRILYTLDMQDWN